MPPLGATELSSTYEFSDTAPRLIERFRQSALGTFGRIAVVPLAVAGSAIVEGSVAQGLHPDAAYAASSNDTETGIVTSQNTRKNKKIKNANIHINCSNMSGDEEFDLTGTIIGPPGPWAVDGCNYGGGSGTISPSINAPYLNPNRYNPNPNAFIGQVPSGGKSTIYWESGAKTTFDYTIEGKLPRKDIKVENLASKKCDAIAAYDKEFYSIAGQVIVTNAKNGKQQIKGSILSFLCYYRGPGTESTIQYATPGGVALKVKQPSSP